MKMKKLFTNLKNILSLVKEDIAKYVPNAKIYIFGSIARGKYTAASDIDIIVVVDRLEELDVHKLKTIIKKKYPGYPIEVHIVNKQMLERWYKRFVREEELVEI